MDAEQTRQVFADDRVWHMTLAAIHRALRPGGHVAAVVSHNELRFRSQAELTRSPADAGFALERVFGDWDRQPVGAGSPELIFLAARG